MSRITSSYPKPPENRLALYTHHIQRIIDRLDAVQPLRKSVIQYFTEKQGKKLNRTMVAWMEQKNPGWHFGWDTSNGMIHLNAWNGELVPANNAFRFLLAHTQRHASPRNADAMDPELVTGYLECYNAQLGYRNRLLLALQRGKGFIAHYENAIKSLKQLEDEMDEVHALSAVTELFKGEVNARY